MAASTESIHHELDYSDAGKQHYRECKIAVLGAVDSGKSTTIGVLITGKHDDGRGLARLNALNYQHEITSGRTSSVSRHILSYDSENSLINKEIYAQRHGVAKMQDWPLILERASKVVTLIDLCGHEKYFATTVMGVMSNKIDYAILTIAANKGISKMTLQHISLILTLQVPFIIVLTKVDIAPKNVYADTLEQIKKLIKSKQKYLQPVSHINDIVEVSKKYNIFARYVLLFAISNTTGQGVDLLSNSLCLLPTGHSNAQRRQNDEVVARITEIFVVSGLGTVVLVNVKKGIMKLNDAIYLGPSSSVLCNKTKTGNGNNYIASKIKSIHRNRQPVGVAMAGQSVTILLQHIKRAQVRKGMVLVNNPYKSKAVTGFMAEIYILSHSTTVKVGYCPMLVIGAIRAPARLTKIENKEYLRSKDRARVRFEFCQHTEYVNVGAKIVITDGCIKAFGKVIAL